MANKTNPNPRDSSIVEKFIDNLDGSFSQSVSMAASGGATGTSGARIIAAASTNATVVKATPGQVYGLELANNAAYAVFLKLYDKATAPNPAADTPVRTIQIPAGGRAEINRPNGIPFALGISYVAVKLLADTDVTVLVAGDLVGSIDYK